MVFAEIFKGKIFFWISYFYMNAVLENCSIHLKPFQYSMIAKNKFLLEVFCTLSVSLTDIKQILVSQ